MPREYRDYIDDILNSIEKIESYTENMTFEDFLEDDLVQDAVIRNLELIGEAVKNIPENIKAKNPSVDWKSIAGLRDILIHAYFGVDNEIIWDVVENKLSTLDEEINVLKSELE